MKKKILVRGPALSQTGYGEQCRFALRALRSREDLFDIYLMNIPWGGTNWIFEDSEERRWLDELIIKAKPLLEQQKQIPQMPLFDISLQVTIPNELQRMAPQNILYTAGIETDRACAEWIAKCHQFADKILVISEHAKTGLQVPIKAHDQNGNEMDFVLDKPIEVVHYPVKKVETKELDLQLETDFNFLTISQWGPRKNLANTIGWFCEEFKDNPNVGLVVKTFAKGNSQIDKNFLEKAFKSVLDNFPDRKCKVYFLHGYMNEQELHSLYIHPKIKAMVNFGHGEGYGLPLFEAAYSGLPVITHNFGGQKDFLYAPKKDKKGVEKLRAHFTKVNHELKPVQKEVLWKGVIEPDMNWAYPNQSSCKVAMREAVKNYGLLQGEAKRLKEWLEQEFEEGRKYEEFTCEIMGKNKEPPELVRGISFCIPTDGKKRDKTDQEIASIHRTMEKATIPYEIIVAGDVSWLEEEKNTVLVATPEDAHNGLLAKLRNNAGEKASYNTLVFVDDDFIFPETWASRLIKYSEQHGWRVLANRILLPDGSRFWDRATWKPQHKLVSYDHPSYDSGLYQTGGFWIIRKKTYDQHKWDSSIPIYNDIKNKKPNEDIEMSTRYHRNQIFIEFDKENYVWHNDESYTEFGDQTLKKQVVKERTGFSHFPDTCEQFKADLVN